MLGIPLLVPHEERGGVLWSEATEHPHTIMLVYTLRPDYKATTRSEILTTCRDLARGTAK